MSDEFQLRKDIDRFNRILNELNRIITGEYDLSSDDVKGLLSNFYDISQVYNKHEILDKIYPIGSIYMSVNDVNPSLLFGGLWVRIKDRFLLASGDSYSNESIGGESEHTLNISEMPSHTHTQNPHKHTQAQHRHKEANKYSNGSGSASAYMYTSNRTAVDHYTDYQTPAINDTTATNQNTGGSQPHNNMPPYLVVNIWKRVEYYEYIPEMVSWNVTSVSNNIGRKCYKNIVPIPEEGNFTVECVINVHSIGLWANSYLCFTTSYPVDNTTTSTEDYGRIGIIGIGSDNVNRNNAPVHGSGGVSLEKNTDYLLKFSVQSNTIQWWIIDMDNNILSTGNTVIDVSKYSYISYYSFEGWDMSIKEFKIY